VGVLPGVLGCRTLRRTVQVRLRSNTLWFPGGPPASPERSRWRAGTTFFTVSPHRLVKHSGYEYSANHAELQWLSIRAPLLVNWLIRELEN